MEVKTQKTLPFGKFAKQLLERNHKANIAEAFVDLYNKKLEGDKNTLTRETVVKTIQQAVS